MKTKRLPIRNLWLALAILLIGQNLAARQITVQGTVRDTARHPLPGVTVLVKHASTGTVTGADGRYAIPASVGDTLVFRFIGMASQEHAVADSVLNVTLRPDENALDEVVVTGYQPVEKKTIVSACCVVSSSPLQMSGGGFRPFPDADREEYARFTPNKFLDALDHPLSTFSIDVDAASYANARRHINNGKLPPKDAVRTEEFVNYFRYDYPAQQGEEPVSVTTDVSAAPWNAAHRLVRVGIKAKEIETGELPASNLVFLIDVSGSMNAPNKLPLLKSSLKLLVEQLRPQDRVAIVTYANGTKEALAPTPGDRKADILRALDELEAWGGTNGGEGIQRAYRLAESHFLPEGNNRVILATDGDFNIGISSPQALEELVAAKRESGIYLTVLGFGTGNYKDNRTQTLAEKGNGNNAYIDNLQEARKVLVSEFGGTLFTVAKDVKVQVEFNPARARAYRLIGYESRLLEAEDFNDDTKDAGEMGAGHAVTALYEIVPAGVESPAIPDIDPLKYQKTEARPARRLTGSPELLTVKLRYKEPDGSRSKKMEVAVTDKGAPLAEASEDFRFAAAVAGFSMLLRQESHLDGLTYDDIIRLARNATGDDPEGYRREFVRLAESARLLAK